MRHSEHAHLLSNIEKFPLPILGSMFPFWNPTGVFLQSVAHVEKDKPSLFVASLQSTSFVVSPAEGEGAPGSSGSVHSGRSGPTAWASPVVELSAPSLTFGLELFWSAGLGLAVCGLVVRRRLRLLAAAVPTSLVVPVVGRRRMIVLVASVPYTHVNAAILLRCRDAIRHDQRFRNVQPSQLR